MAFMTLVQAHYSMKHLSEETDLIFFLIICKVPCIENWAKDASPLIGGEARLFADFQPSIDSIYDSLLKPNENDATVQEIL